MGAEPPDYFQTARETCARARVDPLATMFKTEPKPETVARDYSLWVRATLKQDEPRARAVYEGCLEGFRD